MIRMEVSGLGNFKGKVSGLFPRVTLPSTRGHSGHKPT